MHTRQGLNRYDKKNIYINKQNMLWFTKVQVRACSLLGGQLNWFDKSNIWETQKTDKADAL